MITIVSKASNIDSAAYSKVMYDIVCKLRSLGVEWLLLLFKQTVLTLSTTMTSFSRYLKIIFGVSYSLIYSFGR